MSPLEPKPAGSRDGCLYCGEPLSFVTRFGSKRRFCSTEHRDRYSREYAQLAVQALKWEGGVKKSVPAEAPLGEPGPDPAANQLALHSPAAAALPRANAVAVEANFRTFPRSTLMLARTQAVFPKLPAFNREFGGLGETRPMQAPQARLLVSAKQEPQLQTKFSVPHLHPASVPGAACRLVPESAGPVWMERHLRRPSVSRSAAAPAIFQHRQAVPGSSALRFLRPAGFGSPRTNREGCQPALIQAPILYDATRLSHRVPPRALPVRLEMPRERGIFLPRLRTGTLRPRMALGKSETAAQQPTQPPEENFAVAG